MCIEVSQNETDTVSETATNALFPATGREMDLRRLLPWIQGPLGERLSSGYIEIVDLSVVRRNKQFLAAAHPGQGPISGRADLSRSVDEETAIVAGGCRRSAERRDPRSGGDETPVG